MGRSGLGRLLLDALQFLRVERVEVHRRQHQSREGATHHQAVQGFARVREQDVRAERAQGVAHGSGVQALDQEDPGLLDFGDEGGFFAILHGDREGQHHFMEVAIERLLPGVQVQGNARCPFLAENFRALRRLEGQVAHIDALQGKLRILFALGGGAVASLFSHGKAFLSWVLSRKRRVLSLEQRIQLTSALQGIQIVAATNMAVTDPDLRHRGPLRLAGHLRAQLGLAVDLDFIEVHALMGQ
ncbi:hypothetical protein D3C80_1325810 [compost metagenome]